MAYSCTKAQYAEVLAILGGATSDADALCQSLDVGQVGATTAVLTWSVAQMNSLRMEQLAAEDIVSGLIWGTNTFFVLTNGALVFIMQIGFAMFVAGVVRAKNMSSILMKSLMDTFITAVCFYLIGYSFVMGDQEPTNGFIGYGDFALSGTARGGPDRHWQRWFWNWVYCAASTTIMAGAIAERSTFISYILYCIFYSSWVYPVVAHWQWSYNGWLSPRSSDVILGTGTIDFARSNVVHTTGAFASLCAILHLGPRIGRFSPDSNVKDFKGGHNPALYLLGTFMLWMGWYGFNPGSQHYTTSYNDGAILGRTAVCTTLSCAASGVASLILAYWRTRTWEMLSLCTGAIGGLVAITAGCSVVEPWAATICGLLAAPSVVYGDVLMDRLQIDDPAMAWSCHGISGIWGTLFVGFFAKEAYMYEVYQIEPGQHKMGLFYGGHGQLLLCQFMSIVVTVAWSMFWMYGFFWLLNRLGLLRISLGT
eukprot:gene27340-biopygen3185